MRRVYALAVAAAAVLVGMGGASSAGQGQAAATETSVGPALIAADKTGRYAVAWPETESTPTSNPPGETINERRFAVMFGPIESAKRVVRHIIVPPDRDPSPYFAIALDRHGRAVLSWIDYASNRPIDMSPHRLSMVRVDRAGHVIPVGRFDGAYENVKIATTPTGHVIAVASKSNRVFISTLRRSGNQFTGPRPLASPARLPGHRGSINGPELRLTGHNFATVLWSETYYPDSLSRVRVRIQKIGFTGARIGPTRTLEPPPNDDQANGLLWYDGYRDREAITWIQGERRFTNWMRTGPAGHLRTKLPLKGIDAGTKLALSPSGRVFVIGAKYGPIRNRAHEQDTIVVAGWVGHNGLRHPRVLARARYIDPSEWFALRALRGGTPVALWSDGHRRARLHAATLSTANRVLRSTALRLSGLDLSDAVALDGHRVLVVLTSKRHIRIRLLHL
ncbi:MAG: hypothetical protein QOI98_2135 [Solirubrobacteraceae bacterium]|nr:hypothetical protein [Solirubrobacteraceae bacterium]